MSQLKSLPLHPVLVAAFPALSFYASNANEVSLRDAVQPLLVCAGLGLLFQGMAYLVLRNRAKAGMVATLALVWFWVFAPALRSAVGSIGAVGWVVAFGAWSAVFSALVSWVALSKREFAGVATSLNVVGVTLVVSALLPLAFSAIQAPSAEKQAPKAPRISQPIPFGASAIDRPDVYVIVLDAYGRRDQLLEHFDYADELSVGLEHRGFYVASESTSNYNETRYSLPSMLNHRYVEGMSPFEIQTGTCASEVREDLRLAGYRFDACATGYWNTNCRDADHFVRPSVWKFGAVLSNFEQLLMNMTPLERWLRTSGKRSPYGIHRERILSCLAGLPSFSGNGERDFVFAHIVSPHEPFVFGAGGEDVSPYDRPYRLRNIYEDPDLPDVPGRVGPEYARRYREQATFIAGRVLEVVDEILERAEFPPIIIVQGDHGPYGFTPDLRDARYPILNAYYLPGNDAMSDLYPTITPVNSFRIILNAYFGGEHELLPDERGEMPEH